MTNRPRRLRRCQLSVPGSSEKMMTKAAGLDVDHVFLDLEDAVAPNEKPAARGKVAAALNGLDWGRKTRCVRINDLGTQYAHDDVIEVVESAGANLDTIMIPKVLDADHVRWVEILLAQLEAKLGLARPIGIEVLIEEVEGMMNVERIAAASPRLEALVFGMGDYSASQGIAMGAFGGAVGGETDYPGDIWHYPRYKMTIAARANRVDPVDGPFANFRDGDGYREECRRALALGCVGKWAIHPAQAEIAQSQFTPPADEVAKARALAAAYAEAVARGEGAIQIDGVMIDAASVRIVQNTIDKADLIGM
jgi:citrate lyase subunit beta/citryl-CoA lyase